LRARQVGGALQVGNDGAANLECTRLALRRVEERVPQAARPRRRRTTRAT
jgi:hypothetical protein